MDSTSTTLLRRLRETMDQSAWDRFVEIYTPLLYYWCRRIGLSRDETADLVQEIFVVLIEELPRFSYNPQGSFRAWLRTILVNKWREQQRRGRLVQVGIPADELPQEDKALEAVWDAEYRRSVLDRLTRQIRGEFRPATWEAFWETAVREREPDEVAAELGMTVGAVYTAKSHVLRRLREVADGLLD